MVHTEVLAKREKLAAILGDPFIGLRACLMSKVQLVESTLYIVSILPADEDILGPELTELLETRIGLDPLERRCWLSSQFSGHSMAGMRLVVISATNHMKQADAVLPHGPQ